VLYIYIYIAAIGYCANICITDRGYRAIYIEYAKTLPDL
jgi:hypothetical protein